MELILTRIAKRKTYTIGRLCIRKQVADEYLTGTADEYFCDTLEPTWRDYKNGEYKIKGKSAIQKGGMPWLSRSHPSSSNGCPFCWATRHSRSSGVASASTLATQPRTPRAASSWARTARWARCWIAASGSTS